MWRRFVMNMGFLGNRDVRTVLIGGLPLSVILVVLLVRMRTVVENSVQTALQFASVPDSAAQEIAHVQETVHTVCNASIIAAVVVLAVIWIVYLVTASREARQIQSFTLKVKENLNHHQDLSFEDLDVGDLSVLQNAVADMVRAHYSQHELVLREKKLLSDALADIAHQIKTPLQSISLTTEMMMDEDLDDTERVCRAEEMMEWIDRIVFLVHSLLRMSRLDAGVENYRIEDVSVRDLLRRVHRTLGESLDSHGVSLHIDVPKDLCVRVDRIWFSEALTNVIKNCGEKTPGCDIFITAEDNPVYTEIVIRDTGVGIAEEDLPHIFDRFYKGRNSSSNSTGIGLAFARQVIHSMNGTIRAGNHPDGGAVFTIRMIRVNV